MSGILDEEKKVTHKALADKVEKKLDESKYIQKELGVEKGFDVNQLDWAYIPNVQSGGTYDLTLKHDTPSSSENLHAGTIIASLGFRYMFYSALVARTYLVDPVKSQESNYKLLLSIHDSIIKESRAGVTVKSLYEKAVGMVKAKKPELEGNFLKSIGFGIGMETKDDTLLLDAKNDRTLRDGMTLTITTGFKDLTNEKPQDKKSKTYALLVADTIRVTNAAAVVFTKDAPSDLESTSFFFKESEDEAAPQKSAKPKKDSRIGAVATANIQKTRLRAERATMADAEKDAQRRIHQKEVHDKKQAQGVQKFSKDTGALNGVEEKKFKRFESYKRDNQFPNRAKLLEVCVDERNQTVVLPIMGRPVPFHINTIKNASRTEEQGYSFLRINFLSPGQGVGRKDDQPFEDPEAHFVRSLTFRSKDVSRMADITDQITDLKKASVRREQEKKEMEDVVEQDKLIENRNRKNVPILPGVYIRPGLEGKRASGNLEVHQNGIRYTHGNTGARVDILFSNVKHLFFQPSEQELIVIIHLTLIDPIMLGKKKSKEVQFIQEALANTIDETGNKKRKQRYGDEEEFEQEQEERRRRAETNRTFKKFADLMADAARQENLAVDVPFVELGFQGVPARSSVLVTPTTDCLVQLTEPPFLCVTLSDIEIVHLERVQFGLKNFDMVIVFSDFNRTPMHINTIPVENLDPVKDWLDSVDIPFSQGPLNLNWTPIMKTIQANPYEFFKGGGWDFLNEESDDEGSDESEEESAFEMSDSEVAELSDEESEASDFDDDASADGDSGDASLDESEVGEDWDELEKKAERKDKETNLDESEDDRRSKSKPKAKASASGKKR
jgi:nucleosome binding factor SPN SPT16 subunit